jgi:hypothetical protein
MKTMRFFVLWFLLVSSLGFAALPPAVNGSQTAGSTSQTLIQSVTPQTINLTPGGPGVAVTMTGTGLGNITAIQVIQPGKLAEGFEVTLAPSSATARAFDIKATSAAAVGEYQIRIIMRAQKRDLPSNTAKVVVKAGTASKSTAQKAQAAAPAASAQAAAQPAQAPRSALPPKDTRVIRSSSFNSIVMNVFNGAYFDAMSCGGRDSERKTTANVPNAYFKQESLDRLVYKYTDAEVERSKRGPFRETELRACVDDWKLTLHDGSIEAGRFKLVLNFAKIQAIKTRGMEQHIDIIWSDMWDWADKEADEYFPNYRFSGGVEILLVPTVDMGGLSYRLAEARWEFYGPLTGWVPSAWESSFWKEVIEPKITHYKDRMLEVIRQRVMAMFNDPAVRARFSAALTQSVKSGDFATRTIVGVSGKGEAIEVTFQK